jgi:hypothetical protein
MIPALIIVCVFSISAGYRRREDWETGGDYD